MRSVLWIWLAVCGCGFQPSAAVGGDAPISDARRVDARTDGAPDAPPDAELAPAAASVQSLDPTYITGSQVTIALTETAGNVLIAAVYTSSDTATFTVTDTAGLTWTSTPAIVNTLCPMTLQLWYAPVTASGLNQVTGMQGIIHFMGMSVSEYSGVSAVDTVATMASPAPASDTASTGTVTTTHQAMTFAAFADNNSTGTMTPGSGWTERVRDTQYYTMLVDNAPGAAPGAVQPTAGLPRSDNCWAGAAIALRTP